MITKKVKVGFYCPSKTNASKYGGSTFYEFLIRALDDHAGQNNREIVLFCNISKSFSEKKERI